MSHHRHLALLQAGATHSSGGGVATNSSVLYGPSVHVGFQIPPDSPRSPQIPLLSFHGSHMRQPPPRPRADGVANSASSSAGVVQLQGQAVRAAACLTHTRTHSHALARTRTHTHTPLPLVFHRSTHHPRPSQSPQRSPSLIAVLCCAVQGVRCGSRCSGRWQTCSTTWMTA